MKMNCVLLLRFLASTSIRCSKCVLLGLLLVVLSGCGREDIQVYTVPKDKTVTPPAAAASTSMPGIPPARPQVIWTLPQGWQESGAGQMSVASFSIKGEGGQEALVTITPLARLAGRDPEIVNMWREQVGLEPLEREEAVKQFETVDIGGETANLFQIEGKPKGESNASRIVTAIVHRSEASWFYKLAGDAALVAAQKPVFIEFLKTIRLKEAMPENHPPAGSSATATSSTTTKRNWTVPGQWKEVPPGQMQMAKFTVPPRGSAKAEVSVSIFPNDTGGTLANVNRWRKQIGLSEVKEGELSSMVSPLDPSSPDAILVDMKSDSKQIIGAIVRRDGSYWFYKLMGDAEAVTPEKESFTSFAKSKP